RSRGRRSRTTPERGRAKSRVERRPTASTPPAPTARPARLLPHGAPAEIGSTDGPTMRVVASTMRSARLTGRARAVLARADADGRTLPVPAGAWAVRRVALRREIARRRSRCRALRYPLVQLVVGRGVGRRFLGLAPVRQRRSYCRYADRAIAAVEIRLFTPRVLVRLGGILFRHRPLRRPRSCITSSSAWKARGRCRGTAAEIGNKSCALVILIN